MDDALHILEDDDRNVNVAYFNWNGKRWKLNFNWLDSDFNRNDRFVRPRYCLLAPASRGSFFCKLSLPATEHTTDFD